MPNSWLKSVEGICPVFSEIVLRLKKMAANTSAVGPGMLAAKSRGREGLGEQAKWWSFLEEKPLRTVPHDVRVAGSRSRPVPGRSPH